MRAFAWIEDPGVIRRILDHLGLWAPLATERSPPLVAGSGPPHSNLPLGYYPVPEIAWVAARNARDAGQRLPRAGGWNRLQEMTADPDHDTPGSGTSPGEDKASVSIRPVVRIAAAFPYPLPALRPGTAGSGLD
jgi:hypothetical protein